MQTIMPNAKGYDTPLLKLVRTHIEQYAGDIYLCYDICRSTDDMYQSAKRAKDLAHDILKGQTVTPHPGKLDDFQDLHQAGREVTKARDEILQGLTSLVRPDSYFQYHDRDACEAIKRFLKAQGLKIAPPPSL